MLARLLFFSSVVATAVACDVAKIQECETQDGIIQGLGPDGSTEFQLQDDVTQMRDVCDKFASLNTCIGADNANQDCFASRIGESGYAYELYSQICNDENFMANYDCLKSKVLENISGLGERCPEFSSPCSQIDSLVSCVSKAAQDDCQYSGDVINVMVKKKLSAVCNRA